MAMIKIEKNTKIPAGLRSDTAQGKVRDVLKEKREHSFSDGVYGHPTVRVELKKIYRDKCGYCETRIRPGATPQVEHYRPKKALESSAHFGYYWLGYEWSNLLLCCPCCNRAKGTSFPIAGIPVTSPQENREESGHSAQE